MSQELISDIQLDILKELVNMGVGKAAGGLNQMTKSHVQLKAPEIYALAHDELKHYAEDQVDKDIVILNFEGGINGTTALIFKPESGTNLVNLLLGQAMSGEIPDEMHIDTLKEVGNIVLIWIISTLGTVLGMHMEYEPLDYTTDYSFINKVADPDDTALVIKTHFVLEDHLITGNALVLFKSFDFKTLLKAIDKMSQQM